MQTSMPRAVHNRLQSESFLKAGNMNRHAYITLHSSGHGCATVAGCYDSSLSHWLSTPFCSEWPWSRLNRVKTATWLNHNVNYW